MQNLTWTSSPDSIACQDGNGATVYRDSQDHWTNAVCRLLGLSDAEGRQWVETVAAVARQQHATPFDRLSIDAALAVLRQATHQYFSIPERTPALPPTPGPTGAKADLWYATTMREAPEFAVAGNAAHQHGWLIDTRATSERLTETVEYDQSYFEGETHGLGYGKYLEQQGWRLEKAARLIRQIDAACLYAGHTLPADKRAIDIGSGYGFFRKALGDAGWQHDGVELSAYACEVGRKLFGFDTYAGSAEAYLAEMNAAGRYHLAGLWDVIEHVPDPAETFRTIATLLAPGGLVAIRTPSIAAVELDVFGPAYHSLKKEHLNYFSPASLGRLLGEAGLSPLLITTQSHLLNGFFPGKVLTYDKVLKGSDIFAVARKV
ncbi:MAG TPA: class I SAM-dependent methyltransferase [Tepidisphaeraceae bacterium]|jgi:2-polyprenyl-3-methyl-5-hydroxy-6-metoxy-1,4-benzoquinol methylase|nr:class I SAM-dependent methyltransferase [Tepidisphaeraceae bacterium]